MRPPLPRRIIFKTLDDLEEDDRPEPDDNPIREDFIPLEGGRRYLRQTEIVGVAWIGPRKEAVLRVFLTDAPHSEFSGEDARAIMRCLGLPEECP